MKGNKKILVIAILLLLIAVSYGTYAIYKSALSGTATVNTAAWHIAFSDGSENLEDSFNVVFGDSDCVNNHVKPGRIAPGATCTKTITLDASGTEVDVEYTATALPANVKVDGNTVPAEANQFNVTLSGGGTGTIAYNANPQTATLTLTLSWAGNDADTNPNTTNTGLAGKIVTVPVTLVAKQVPVTAS